MRYTAPDPASAATKTLQASINTAENEIASLKDDLSIAKQHCLHREHELSSMRTALLDQRSTIRTQRDDLDAQSHRIHLITKSIQARDMSIKALLALLNPDDRKRYYRGDFQEGDNGGLRHDMEDAEEGLAAGMKKMEMTQEVAIFNNASLSAIKRIKVEHDESAERLQSIKRGFQDRQDFIESGKKRHRSFATSASTCEPHDPTGRSLSLEEPASNLFRSRSIGEIRKGESSRINVGKDHYPYIATRTAQTHGHNQSNMGQVPPASHVVAVKAEPNEMEGMETAFPD